MTIKNEISSTTENATTTNNDIDFGLSKTVAPRPPPSDLEAYGTTTSSTNIQAMATTSSTAAKTADSQSPTYGGGGGSGPTPLSEDDPIDPIEYQRRIRKKQCWIILITIISMVVLLFATGMI